MLNKDISSRLRAGALVILVEEADELIARKAAELAGQQFQPVQFSTAADQEVLSKIEAHKTGEGTLILSDVLRAHGNNPVVVRLIREIALQERDKSSRLILIEVPGTEVPAALRSDIEYIIPKVPTILELKNELDDFAKSQDAKLPGNGEVKHEVASSVAGLARHEAYRLFCRSWAERGELDVIWLRREKATRIAERLGGALTFIDTDCPDVGGADILKGWLKTRKNAFLSEAARKYGLPEPKGVLLLGIQGCGKSLTVKTIGQNWGLPVLRLDAGKLFGSLVGQSESQTRQAIEAAEACAPCILWVDEIEKAFGNAGGLDGGTSQRVLGTLLTWLQEKTAAVFVAATANSIESLPPEILRKGRFDEIFFVDLPNLQERAEIAKIHIVRRKRNPKEVRADLIAAATEGFSGAEIEQVIIDALFTSYSDNAREVTTKDVLDAVKATVPLSKTMKDKIDHLRGWANGRAKFASTTVSAKTSELRRVGVSA